MKIAISALLLAASSTLAPAAQAAEGAVLTEEQLASRLPAGGGAPVQVRFPVQQVLEALTSARGFSFVFDSKALAGKSIRPVNISRDAESDLAGALSEADLQLRKISKTTYAVIVPRDQDVATREADIIAPPPAASADILLVTGFYPRESVTPASKHIFAIEAEDLAFAAALSPADSVNDLPQSIASVAPGNTTLLGSAAGLALADLRGLGPERTLVMINGRKRTMTLGGNGTIKGVDLNTIPAAFLERIEIQSASGAALLDDSAIAGVVNLVVKSPEEGATFGAQSGISQKGDGFNTSVHFLGGHDFANGLHAEGGIEYSHADSIAGASRDFFSPAYGFALNGRRSFADSAVFTPGFGGSSNTPEGAFVGAIDDSGFSRFQAPLIPARDGSISPFVGALDQLYQWTEQQTLVPGNSRAAAFLNAEYELPSEWRAFIEVDASRTRSSSNLAPTPAAFSRGRNMATGDAIAIPIGNPTLPASIRDAAIARFGPDVTALVFEHRFEESGPRRTKVARTAVNFVAGIERETPGFDFTATYRLGRNLAKATEYERIDLNRLQTTLDPQACMLTAGCHSVDFFGADQISDEALEFISIPEINRKLRLTEHEVIAGFSKALDESDDNAGSVAAGIEFRRSSFSDTDDIDIGVIPIGYLGGAGSAGTQTSIEIYAALQKKYDQPSFLPGSVDILLSARAIRPSRETVVGNFESGIDWSPGRWISLHARQQIGRRAPDVFERFYRGATLQEAFADPCAPQFRKGEVDINCSSSGLLGVDPGFVQTASLATVSSIANPDLKPERLNSRAYGVSVQPSNLFGVDATSLSFSATWIAIDIKDGIDLRSNDLFACYSSVAFSSSACAPNPVTGEAAIIRDAQTGQITKLSTRLQNATNLSWRGLDLELKYRQELSASFPADSVWVSALHTYTHKVTQSAASSEMSSQQPSNVDERNPIAGLVDHPHHRTLFSVGAKKDALSIVMFGTRRGAARTADVDYDEVHIPPAWYLDLTGRFDIGSSAYVQLSVENIGNERPEITAFNTFGNFAPQYYDPIGRRFSLSFRGEY